MPALAALAQDLALTPMPSVPATAICTATEWQGLAPNPFHMHTHVWPASFLSVMQKESLIEMCYLSAAKEFSAVLPLPTGDQQSAIQSTGLRYQRIHSIISALTVNFASSVYHICTFIEQSSAAFSYSRAPVKKQTGIQTEPHIIRIV